MSNPTYAAIFTATVAVVRAALWLWPTPSPTVRGFRLHHWMFGAALVVLVAALYWRAPLAAIPAPAAALSAIGTGLFADEATFLWIGGKTHADNYSRASLAGTALIVASIDALLLLA